MVWVWHPTDHSLWLISHKDIYTDIADKGRHTPEYGRTVIDALARVCQGEDPDAVLRNMPPAPAGAPGEPVEVLLKAYKWIWGQEDCNYPNKAGRRMSMDELLKLREAL